MHAESPFPCDYITSRNGYCKRVMTSTAESKRVLKIPNCTKNEHAMGVWVCLIWWATGSLKRLAYLGQSLSGDAVWRRMAIKVFPRLKSDSKDEGRRKPWGKTPFVRECCMVLRNLSRSSDLSRPWKELYWELVVGSASDPLSERRGWTVKEVCSHWNWAPGSGFLNNSEFSLTWRLARNALPLFGLNFRPGRYARLCSLLQWFGKNGWARLLLLRASSSALGSRRGVDGSHRTKAARAARRWLRRRQHSASISGWEACGVSRDLSCS